MWNKVTSTESSRASTGICIVVAVLLLPSAVLAQGTAAQSAAVDDPNARPPVTQADLQIMKRAIDVEIGEPRADSVAQCKSIAFGAKPCGGPWMFLVYSTTRTDESKLQRLVREYNALQKKINAEERLGSDCSMVLEPELVLENGVCAAKRR